MTRELVILRHGKSDWDAGVDDFNRPLKTRGKRGGQKAGCWMLEKACRPDLIITSPAVRAKVTAEKCAKAMNIGIEHIVEDSRLYEADLRTLLTVLAEIDSDKHRVLLIGHNPGLEHLLRFLASENLQRPADGKFLPTAAFVRFLMPFHWTQLTKGCATLLNWVRTKQLPDNFPYPIPGAKERRLRPAYYYTQSGVIPFRLERGLLRVLMVRSSKNNHWVFPKGIVEPGLTPQESAAQEALEEAGVKGEVNDNALGTFSIEKWGAKCVVTMYSMQVSELLHESIWEEKHRGRVWVSPEQAAERVRYPELAGVLNKLTLKLRSVS